MLRDETPDEPISPFGDGEIRGRARAADTVIVVSAVIAGLYFGREVLVPIALAVLLSFVLAPLVGALHRLHAGRIASVFLSVFMAFAILVGLGAVIGKQLAELASDLPEYQRVITHKVDALKTSGFANEIISKASGVLHGLNFNIGRPPAQPSSPEPTGSPPHAAAQTLLPVEVHEPALEPMQILKGILSVLLPPLTTAAIVVVFVILILLQQRDLRDRFIGLTGAQDLHRTTKALDDAAERLSRYFSLLTAINAGFGATVALGLTFIGVPNPILWGIFAAVLRFLPYVGAFIGAAFPMAVAAAVTPGWSLVFETGLLFLVIETITGQLVEPHVFGHTTGMSPLAVVIAAAFWALLWGPAGLLLSTPITACLVVLGRHVEKLNFIELLLGDRPALSPEQSLYQRILASDPDEAAFQAERLLKTMSLLDYYETVALPALTLAQADLTRGVLEPSRQVSVFAAVAHVVANLADHVDSPAEGGHPGAAPHKDEDAPKTRKVLCFAGRTPLDQAACAILVQLIERRGVAARLSGPQALAADGGPAADLDETAAICIVYLDRHRMAAVRYSVRRLRKRFPHTPIAACVWGAGEVSELEAISNADATVASLREAVDFCVAAATGPATASGATAAIGGPEPSGKPEAAVRAAQSR
jgi:predicted PurR-regulated permease PerM